MHLEMNGIFGSMEISKTGTSQVEKNFKPELIIVTFT